MFIEMAGTDQLVSFIMNSLHVTQKIFLMLDAVHLLKCIRSNWVNDIYQTFTFSNFDNYSLIRNASFNDIVIIYRI